MSFTDVSISPFPQSEMGYDMASVDESVAAMRRRIAELEAEVADHTDQRESMNDGIWLIDDSEDDEWSDRFHTFMDADLGAEKAREWFVASPSATRRR